MNQWTMRALQAQMARQRREVLIRRVLHLIRETVRLEGKQPDTRLDDVRICFTDESARVIAPLIEAVEILEAMTMQDGCKGHEHCTHHMDAWHRALELLRGKWTSDNWPGEPW